MLDTCLRKGICMKIIVNGEERDFDGPLALAGLLEALEIRTPRVAAMVNGAVVKRDQRAETLLAEGDQVEIIQMVGGG